MALAVSAMIGVRGAARRGSRLRGWRGWRSGRPSPASARPSGSGPRPRPPRPRRASSPLSTTIGSTPIWCSRVFSTSWLTGLSSAASTRNVGSAASVSALAPAAGRTAAPAASPTFGQRQLDDEGRALAQLALDLDLAAHQLRQLAADGQAQPGAAEPPRGRGVGLGELLEQRARAGRPRCRCRCRTTGQHRRAPRPAAARR